MKGLLRHLPLLLVLTAALIITSCGDEPASKRHDPVTPNDTTHHHTNDTTHNPADTTHNPADTIHNPADTTHRDTTVTTFTVTLSAPRDYGYMGQTLALNAVTSTPATVTWTSGNTLVATVSSEGLVRFANITADADVTITARANQASDTLRLHNRHWTVAAQAGNGWTAPAYHPVHRGDTLNLTIVDSALRLINDDGFNAAACQWTLKCRQADIATLFAASAAPSAANGWQYRLVIADNAPQNVTFTVLAAFGEAAASLACTIVP